jgi:hypothetical protein
MYKIIGADEKQYGRVTVEQLRRWIVEGRAVSQTLAQPEGAQEWKALNQFPEFAGDFAAPPISPLAPNPGAASAASFPPPNPVIAGKASSKITAGICGILLGGFGVHKFASSAETVG